MHFRSFYDRHVRFTWRALLRLGVPESDVADAVQDVFVVVHRKLPEFEGRSKETTWLFGICLRVASERRRSARARREFPSPAELGATDGSPDASALSDRSRAKEILEGILERMPDEQRIVFTLFELEGMTGDQIAELLELPVGTVRSRLRLARDEFERRVARLRAIERSRDGGLLRAKEAS